MLHYTPTGSPPAYPYYAASQVASRPTLVPGQPMYSVVPPHLQQQRMYISPAPPPHMPFAATQSMPMVPHTFTPPHTTATQPQTTHVAAMQPAAATAVQPQPGTHVTAAIAVTPAHSKAAATLQANLQAAAQASSMPSATSTTSTAAASIAGGLQPGAALPALRSTFAAAGQVIPPHYRPQPPAIHTPSLPPLTSVSSTSTTLALSSKPTSTSAATTSSAVSPYTLFSPDGSSETGKGERAGAKRGLAGADVSGMRAAADSSSAGLPSARRPHLLHSRSAIVQPSSSSSQSSATSVVSLPRPALTPQRSVPLSGSFNPQWRNSVAAAERTRVSDKLAAHLAVDQLDIDQLLTLAACMAEEAIYERAEGVVDYLKRGMALQQATARLAATRRVAAATPATAAPSADSGDADVTGLLALAQSSIEQKQSERAEWGQKSTQEADDVVHNLDDVLRKRRADRSESTDCSDV